MGKIIPMILLLFTLQFSMIILMGIDIPGTELFQAVRNLEDWSSLNLIDYLETIMIGGTLIGAFIGTIVFRSEFPLYLGIAVNALLGFIFVFVEALQQVKAVIGTSEIYYVAIAVIGGIVLMFIFVVLDYARGRD